MRSLWFIPLIIVLLVLAGPAQAIVTLSVTVEDTFGNPLPGADVYVDGSHVGRTDGSGIFKHSHGGIDGFNLKISKSGYQSRTVFVEATERSRTVILSKSTVILTVRVYDEHIAPMKDAVVRVTGPGTDKTDATRSDGKTAFTLDDGETYQVTITALDYSDKHVSVLLSGSNREISAVMERGDRLVFRVFDDETHEPISGAEISIDGDVRGITGDDGVFSYNLRKGFDYLITVKKPEYETHTEREFITGDQQVLSIGMKTAYHTTSVSVFDFERKVVEDADIYLDGVLVTKTDEYGRASLGRLSTGIYLLEIRKSGFESYSQEIAVSEDSIDFIATLTYTPVPVRVLVEDTSHVVIAGAQVYVDEVEKGTTNEQGFLFISLNPGRGYTLTASKDGYYEGGSDLAIPIDGLQHSATITLEPKPDLVLIGGAVLVLLLIAGGVFIVRKKRRKRGSPRRGKSW